VVSAFGEHLEGLPMDVGDGQHPPGPWRLRRPFDHLVADGRPTALHRQRSDGVVDVDPTQTEELPEPHTGDERQLHERRDEQVLPCLGMGEKPAGLLRGSERHRFRVAVHDRRTHPPHRVDADPSRLEGGRVC
jgi:hypothetical protein